VSNEVFLPGFPTLVDAAEDDEAVDARACPGKVKVTVPRAAREWNLDGYRIGCGRSAWKCRGRFP
ncbi:unnamed protein product, partial [Ectocarpus sp. 12 AP-2014]